MSAELALIAALTGALHATDSVPAAVAARVREAVAAEWHVTAERVRLEFGRLPVLSRADSVEIVLLGQGSNGWFAVALVPLGQHRVTTRVHAGVLDSVKVAARALPEGVKITASDIRLDERVQWGRPSLGIEPVGWETRRPLAAGDPLTAATVESPRLIAAGDSVHVTWVSGGVSIGMVGIAMGIGRLGQPLGVVVDHRRLNALVTGKGTARLQGETP